ncbi:MAG: MFS transporter [Anaerolineae bacterium]|jgi:DHA1 family multidrug resistance protein-like MFS transporter
MVKRTGNSITSSPSWQQNLWAIWFAEFASIIGFSSLLPILPFYVQKLGVTSPDAVKFWSGMIFSAHAVTMAVMAPIWGSLADRYGRKPMVERAMFGGALVIGLMSLAQRAPQLALLRALQGMLTGTVAAANTLVASTAPRDRVGYAMGLLQMAIYLGSSIGPLLGGFIADQLGFHATFLTTSALLLAGGLMVAFRVHEDFSPPPRSEKSVGTTLWSNLHLVFSSLPLVSVLGIRFLMRLAARALSPMMPLVVQSLAPAGAAATLSGLVQGANSAAGAAGAILLGRLSDRWGERRVLMLCALGSATLHIPQYFVRDVSTLTLLQAGSGFVMGGTITALSATLAALAPPGRQGTVYGVESTVTSVANAVGPMLSTALAVAGGLRMPFLGAATLFALAGLATARLLPRADPLHPSPITQNGV